MVLGVAMEAQMNVCHPERQRRISSPAAEGSRVNLQHPRTRSFAVAQDDTRIDFFTASQEDIRARFSRSAPDDTAVDFSTTSLDGEPASSSVNDHRRRRRWRDAMRNQT